MLIFSICIITVIIAHSYINLYIKTRMPSFSCPDLCRNRLTGILVCACFNLLIGAVSGIRTGYLELFVFFMMLLLADIDILIKKIPTELLIAFTAVFFWKNISQTKKLPNPAAIVFAGISFCIFRKKIGIALYDILLFAITGIFVYPITSQIKYSAIFLILWGIGGIINRSFRPHEKTVPLAPCIVLSFFICQCLNRL